MGRKRVVISDPWLASTVNGPAPSTIGNVQHLLARELCFRRNSVGGHLAISGNGIASLWRRGGGSNRCRHV